MMFKGNVDIIMDTIIIQSYRSSMPSWIRTCQRSVQLWAQRNSYDYVFVGDEIFDHNPSWFNQKLLNRFPIRSDLARLLCIKEYLKTYQRAIWLDIDTLVFAPDDFLLVDEPYLFGEERWIQPHKNSWRIYKNVCNAFCQFQQGNAFLDFYIDTALRVIKKIDPQHIAPQIIGPKLLSALHRAVTLPVTPMVGSASPWFIKECAEHGFRLRNRMAHQLPHQSCVALNLCSSLQEEEHILERAIEFLTHRGAISSNCKNT